MMGTRILTTVWVLATLSNMLCGYCDAFVTASCGKSSPCSSLSSPPSSTSALHALSSGSQSRRAFVSLVAGTAPIIAFYSIPTIVSADDNSGGEVGDLSMPSAAEAKSNEDAEMAARLARKAELQRKASKPIGFSESMKNEKAKQKDLQKSQAELREAMCEELGRGC